MTQNKRIALNVVATYGRSLYVLAIGLFCGRWKLMALGQVNYGLLGVVGGLAAFVSFFNSLLSEAVGRFYAFSVGEAQKMDNATNGLEECRHWFSVAIMLHTSVSVLLVSIGYPVGVYAIEHFLTIPLDRITACIWVWRFTCLSCFVGMANVPFNAMYIAKQEIAELTIYSFVTATANVIYLYYAITHPNHDWLVLVGLWTCILSVTPSLIIAIRSIFIFKECRLRLAYMWDWLRLKRIFFFVSCRFITSLMLMLNNNGMTILVNKCLGPVKNAAMTIGMLVSGNCMTLAAALNNAFSPAITNAAGAGDYERMRKLAFHSCSLSTVGLLIFGLPIVLEVKEVMVLWLKIPPADAWLLCIAFIIVAFCDDMSVGHGMAINAMGRIGRFNLCESMVWILVLPMAYVFIKLGFGILGAGLALVVAKMLAVGVKLYFGRVLCGMSIGYWLRRILLPILSVSMASLAVGWLPVHYLSQSFIRVVITTLCIESVFLPLTWCFVLDAYEREVLVSKVLSKLHIRGR